MVFPTRSLGVILNNRKDIEQIKAHILRMALALYSGIPLSKRCDSAG